jgi:hypothetical protein
MGEMGSRMVLGGGVVEKKIGEKWGERGEVGRILREVERNGGGGEGGI